ncbi:uracil-DNA glycosylase [Campylobacter sp. MIT 12-8780]|uniref:uracil-DNA glycosylase n=1 Tax=unclassified Campylobacter TaxID=2593542 RepID=UPI00115C939D|nr:MULTISPECIES: uracil-DNA glycosylase [unclassified Campylobacter]NDJ26824.1 uracil-DNA glycosylase [Campylobacter sp. MIT 19-121]TQR42357.1 uracil-DNA glycosylase [Campylobacter sp. MIT 12-8780]
MQIKLEDIAMNEDWKNFLKPLFFEPFFSRIKQNYIQALQNGKTIYPPAKLTFNAFNLTPLHELKIILLGQDPYHQPNQAMGLSFSVPNGVRVPPSLINIYKELQADLGIQPSKNGDLTKWARQGVLLLNAILSVEANKAASHQNFGWQEFTDAVIALLSKEKQGLVFLLWGNFARSKKSLIDTSKHLVLEAAHPSPLARTGFLGCKHFSKSNEWLIKQGKKPIEWDLNA